MAGHYTYLLWLTVFVWLPILVMTVMNARYFYHYRGTLFYCIRSALLFSIPWDFWAIKTHVWYFPADRILGVWFLGLPLEEHLFIIFVTLYFSMITLILKRRFERSKE